MVAPKSCGPRPWLRLRSSSCPRVLRGCRRSRSELDELGIAGRDAEVLEQRCGGVPQVVDLNHPQAMCGAEHDRASRQRVVRMMGPLSVTAMVCSLCAALAPLAVRRVHPSGSVTYSSVPPEISMGSMAITRPGRSR